MDRMSESEVTMILDTYMYTDYEYASDEQTLMEIVQQMPEHIDVEDKYLKEYSILKEAVKNPKVGELKITCQAQKMGFNKGTNAVAFQSQSTDKLYVIYRGTADGEWVDNANGLVKSQTLQQKEAVAYFDEVIENLGVTGKTQVYVGGHSKGGNKAQFVAMESKNYKLINAAYSVDGQGHSDAAIDRWKKKYSSKEYEERVDKIYAINGENDFVNVLGNNIVKESHRIYIKTGNESWDMAGYHDITAMFARSGVDPNGKRITIYSAKRNPQAIDRGKLSMCVGAISEEVMNLEPQKRDGATRTLMEACEVLNGNKIRGVNGEFTEFGDIFDFIAAGIPAIGAGLASKEGTSLVKTIMNNGQFKRRISDTSSLEINYMKMAQSAAVLDNTVRKIESNACRIEQSGMAIPMYFNGYSFRKPHIENSVVVLLEMARKLKKIAAIEQEAALIYQKFDMEALDILK